jgi:hypothetical protein
MNGQTIVSWLLIGLAVMDWVATVILVRAALRLHEPSLEERATTSVLLSIGASGVAMLAGAYLLGVSLPQWLSFLLLVAGLVILSAPQLVWLAAYKLGRFR